MSLGPCDTCGCPYEECPVSDDDAEWVTDANGNHDGLCCEDCMHHVVDYDYWWPRMAPMYPVETRRTAARRRLEGIRQVAWEDHLRRWLSSAVTTAGCPYYYPPAPWWVGKEWMWANGDAFIDEEALNVGLVRTYGCRCVHPSLGWTMRQDVDEWFPDTPRCRTCNAEAS